jgi:heptosyltransferase-2
VKILLIRFSSAGDILLAAGPVAALKASGHTVYFLAGEKYYGAASALGADEIITVDFKKKGALQGLVSSVKKTGFDAVVDLQGNYRSFIVKNSCPGAEVRTAVKDPVKRRLMAAFKWFISGSTYCAVADKYINACSDFIKPGVKTAKKRKKKGRVLKIAVHAGARWANKRWPYFKELLDSLRLIKGTGIILTGVKDEVVNSTELLYYKKSGVINMIGKTDFPALLKVIKNADVFIGNDTAAAHAASLYGLKCFVFLGPTVRQFGFITERDFTVIEDVRLLCRPCHIHGGDSCPIGTFDCMKNLRIAAVTDEIKKLTSRGK